MKRTLLGILGLGFLAFSLGYISSSCAGSMAEPYPTTAEPGEVKEQQRNLPRLAFFYQDQDGRPDYENLAEAVEATEEAASILCLEDQVPTLLSMFHRESAYDPKAKGLPHEDSAGVAQTRMKELKRWRPFWRQRGVVLEPFRSSVRTQVFFGVAEYADKLRLSHGDVLEAVRRYNGGSQGGKGLARAQRYAKRVMVSRAIIFEKPYAKGEQAAPCL